MADTPPTGICSLGLVAPGVGMALAYYLNNRRERGRMETISMLSFVLVSLAVWAILTAAPRTPVAAWLRRMAVEAPARWLGGVQRGTIIVTFLLLLIGGAMMWLMQNEGALLFGMAMPEIAGMMLAFDVAAYVDALVVVATASSAVRFRAVRQWLLARLPNSGRARRSRRRAVAKAANDDEGHRGFALAA